MDSGMGWTCRRHSCALCYGTSTFYCLCCPHTSCEYCLGDSELAPLGDSNGLCKSCVMRILAEEKSEYGLEGEKTDLEDQDERWRFKEYWEIVKEKEGLTSEDVNSAKSILEKRKNCYIDESDETVSSDTTITSDEMKASPRFEKSCFASIIPENMRLVYIKKSLLEKLLKEPDHSESKLLGSFVTVKNNPRDSILRNDYHTHQFSQVKGIKEISATN
ncbi:uncharacterized protein LOC133720315 [Rosa rugosa]|uniref:uncharacterized protein LOC133720315 n=1 Tax=Rosa rugosa TaxID=74645 RepID=UPI002B406259|nr:uncharacterized protein LOC133720315 [Rosa rugosa]